MPNDDRPDWLRADMNPLDPGSQGYDPTAVHAAAQAAFPVSSRVQYRSAVTGQQVFGRVKGHSASGRRVFVAVDGDPVGTHSVPTDSLARVQPKSYGLDDFAQIPPAPNDWGRTPAPRPDLDTEPIVVDSPARPRTLEDAKDLADAADPEASPRAELTELLQRYDNGLIATDDLIEAIVAVFE